MAFPYFPPMSCSQCPHCRANAARNGMVLPGPAGNFGSAGLDTAFYLTFARAYELACSLGPQPGVRLREANPWLTESQCKSYLKRCRALGYVRVPGRVRRTTTPEPATDDTQPPVQRKAHRLTGTALEPAWNFGDRITRQALRYVSKDDAATDKLWDQLLADGAIPDGDSLRNPAAVAG